MGSGVMEYWSSGAMVEGLISSFSILQYSITPLLLDRDFYDPPASGISLFIVHSSVFITIEYEFQIIIRSVSL
jgi:hypothetical protein